MLDWILNFRRMFTTKGVTKLLVQQVPQPTVHAVLRHGTHLVNLKHVRSIVFEESRALRNLNEGVALSPTNDGAPRIRFTAASRLGE